MIYNSGKYEAMPMGIVLRRRPGATRWAAWSWRVSGVLPGASNAEWRLLREEGNTCEFHAATLMLELHRADTDSYLHGLNAQVPCLYVVMREADETAHPFELVLVTASPYEAQDYADNGEDIVEKVAMPQSVFAWVQGFVDQHHREEAFKKRRRDKKDITLTSDGVGDARIRQLVDVYRSPALAKKERLQ
ncbi:DUF3305 domain-containing protein [Shimia sp. W99]